MKSSDIKKVVNGQGTKKSTTKPKSTSNTPIVGNKKNEPTENVQQDPEEQSLEEAANRERLRLAEIADKILTKDQIAMYANTGYKLVVPPHVEAQFDRKNFHYAWRKATQSEVERDNGLGFHPVLNNGKEIRVNGGQGDKGDGTFGPFDLILKKTRIENYEGMTKAYADKHKNMLDDIWGRNDLPGESHKDGFPDEVSKLLEGLTPEERQSVIRGLIKCGKESMG